MNNPKTILIDARMYGLENAGIGRYIINLIEELKKLSTKEKFKILLRKKYFDQLNFPNNWKKVLANFPHYGIEEQTKLPNIINKENPDLVHFPNFNVPLFWNGKFVVTIHDLTMQRQGTSATTLPLPLYYLKRIPFLYAFNFAVRNSQKIITPTKVVQQDIVNYYRVSEDKLKVIYEGLTELPKTGKNSKKISEPYFLYIGNAYPHKNLEKAIQGIVMLNKWHSQKTLLLIGGSRNIFTERLSASINDLHAEDYVKLIGFVDDKELKQLYKNSIGFIYPSLSEGWGLQGLEAMGAGTLVLASDIPVFREVYEDHVIYFNPKSPQSIEDAMDKALKLTSQKRNQIIKKAKIFVKKYSWRKMAEDTLQVYKEALQK